MTNSKPMRIKAEPTKELFVYIFTRDISYQAAIIELIDNSIDGANRVAVDPNELSDFKVNIEFDSEKISISDNCGGIPFDVAVNYAFRFGRAKEMQPVPRSIGQFGVGMKRALFSFGRRYIVKSATKEKWFRLEIDLEDWLREDDWDFDLTEYGENDNNMEVGTRIEITNLTEEAARQFDQPAFRTRIENEIRNKHGSFIAQGLVVRVDGSTIPRHQWRIVSDYRFSPAYRKKDYNGLEGPVSAKFYAGIGPSNPTDAGWYVICNGRLLLSAEKSEKTGWGWQATEMDAASGTPRYHNQFARFRGYVLFDSDDAGRLPWNSTKTDINPDNSIWRDAREEMAVAMRPVIDFLNLVDKETDLPESERMLTEALSTASTKPIAEVQEEQSFAYPNNPRPLSPPTVNIQFRKEQERVDALRDAMGKNSARSTGEAAFEDAYRRYVDDLGN